MKISARNTLPGVIRKIEPGAAVIKASSVMVAVD
jgi:molybdopterin-binding protein